jgi:hypothetical protein
MSEVTQVKDAVVAASTQAAAADKAIVQAATSGFLAKAKALVSTYKVHGIVGAVSYVGGHFGLLGDAVSLVAKHL